jgi:hypothetical protein
MPRPRRAVARGDTGKCRTHPPRLDHPRVHIIPEWLGGGKLSRKELDDAAQELAADEAGLIVVGEASIEPALDQVFTGTKVVKREIEATVDEITTELEAAFKP